MLVKPKPRKSDGNLLIFYYRSSICSPLVFPEASCVKCECCLFLNSSFMNPYPLLLKWGETHDVDADNCQHISSWNYMMSLLWQTKCFYVTTVLYHSFFSYGHVKHLANNLFYSFRSVPVDPGVAFSFWRNNETESSNIV